MGKILRLQSSRLDKIRLDILKHSELDFLLGYYIITGFFDSLKIISTHFLWFIKWAVLEET